MSMETRIRDSFARQGMMTTLGARLTKITPGQACVEAELTPGLSQQQGFAHGALAFAIGDSAAGYAALSLLDADSEVVTSEMGIHYIAPGRGDRLVARGTVLKPGKRLLVVQADVLAVDATGETLVARLTGTMIRVPATG